jgi:PAS domain-containing protein
MVDKNLAPTWEEILSNHNFINKPVSEMPGKVSEILKSFGVVSAFVSPIFFNKVFWGFGLFEDRKNERYFDEDTVNIMRTATFLCANTIKRFEMAQELNEAEERLNIMLDSTPICCNLIKLNGDKLDVIECNETAVKLFGIKNKEEYKERFFEICSPEFQPDGSRSSEKALICIQKALKEGSLTVEWMHNNTNGTPIPAEVKIERIKYKNDYVIAGYMRDLRKEKKMLTEIKDRLIQQETISEILNDFASAGNPEQIINHSLLKLGTYIDASLVIVFELDYENKEIKVPFSWTSNNEEIVFVEIDLFNVIRNMFSENFSTGCCNNNVS